MAAYRQYTQCVDISNFNPANPYVQAALTGLYVTLPVGVFTALMALAGFSPWCLLLLAEIYVIAGIIGYCYWWLYRRLICIPALPDHPNNSDGSQMVIGTVIDTLPPSDATFPDIDNDFSFGLLPNCMPLGSQGPYTAANPAPPGPYGYLITEQPVTHDAGLTYTGQRGTDFDFVDTPNLDIQSEVLHCEFEGRAIYDMFLASQAALLPVVAAIFACQIPGYGWIVALLLALLGLLLLAVGYGIGKTDDGAPSDLNANLGELHTNGKNHQGADTLLIMGHWVCDAGHRFDHHALYYELHPITFACKTTPLTDCDPNQVILLEKRWKNAVGDAASPTTQANQKLPQNQWQIHPLLDGCESTVIF